MEESTDAWNRGALTKKNSDGNDYYGVIRSSVSSNSRVEYSFIIEHGFHTNKKECEFLMNEENLKKIAVAEAKVFADYFKLNLKENIVYGIEIGPYADKSKAESILSKIQQSGYSARIVEITPQKTIDDLAQEIIDGIWGTGHTIRKAKLRDAGWLELYTYDDIRKRVNALCKR
jgi:hypothetical protein